jgi:hypothetical protein
LEVDAEGITIPPEPFPSIYLSVDRY